MEELESGKAAAGRSRSLVGTADYLAPETIREPDKILPVSDVYSLGCTLYYAVTGKVPFPGGNTADKIRRHLDETPLNPLHFNPDLPEGFCDAIAAMMDKNPDTRTPTAAAVVELLRPWRDEICDKAFGRVHARFWHFLPWRIAGSADAWHSWMKRRRSCWMIWNSARAKWKARVRFRRVRFRWRMN